MADIANIFEKAIELHQQGQLLEAEGLYRAILKEDPTHSDALHYLGVIEYQRKHYDAAVTLIQKALTLNPEDASAHVNMGVALRDLRRPAEALDSYDRALAIDSELPEAHYNRGLALLDLKRPEEALASFDDALTAEPDFAEALNNRGDALRDLERYEEAVASYDRAAALAPDLAVAWYNRGNALRSLKRLDDAVASYDRALAIKPDHVEALSNRGNALRDLERPEAALDSYDRALAVAPDLADVLNNRGNALRDLKRPEEALASYASALAINPDHLEALNNRGNALRDLARNEEALASYDRALKVRPDIAVVLCNRGNVLRALKRHEDALVSYDQALAIEPDFADALNSRGNALRALNRHAEALVSFDRALTVKPDFAEAINDRGNTMRDLGRYEEALADFDGALAINPDYAVALNNRCNVLGDLKRYEEATIDFRRLLESNPDFDYAVGNMLFGQLNCCNWTDYDRIVETVTGDVVAGKHAVIPYIFRIVAESPGDHLQCANLYNIDKYPASRNAVWAGERYGHDRIRVAYLSADFRNHAVSVLAAGLFEAHDKTRFETTAISFGPNSNDELRKRLENAFDRFVDVGGKSDYDTALLLKDLEIDIAVDLTGYTQDERTGILAYRPAPIQVNFLGYPGTLSADYVDYIVADRFVIPADQQAFYKEKVVYLPDTYQPNDSKRRIDEHTPTRAEAGLPETGFVYCSFNNNCKIAPPIFDIWMRLLREVEGSVLWLLGDNAAAIRNLRREAEQRGVAPDRLVFAPRMNPANHLARHRLAGLFLDTLPYNAHTTASDALWAGLPLVTCLGRSFAGRVAGSLLNAVGLPELITNSLADYEALALDLARNEDRLAAIKATLARNRETSPLFDTDRFCRHIETAYETMWERHRRGEPPAGFAVTPR